MFITRFCLFVITFVIEVRLRISRKNTWLVPFGRSSSHTGELFIWCDRVKSLALFARFGPAAWTLSCRLH